MRCLSASDIARVASGELESIHASECLMCRRRIDDDRATRDVLHSLPAPGLSRESRRAIGAELFARLEHEPGADESRRSIGAELFARIDHSPGRQRRIWPVAAIALAAAAGAALFLRGPRGPSIAPAEPSIASVETADIRSAFAAREGVAPVLPGPRIDATAGTRLSHSVGEARDELTLADGTIEIDTRASRDVDVRVGNTVVRVDDATVSIRARKHAIVSVRAVVGAARIDAPDQHVTLERDALWMPTQPSLVAFRDGWVALRAGQYREAIAEFDRVTDPVAREEAMYWAIIAAHRAGDAELARERTAAFLRAFPGSDYAASLARD